MKRSAQFLAAVLASFVVSALADDLSLQRPDKAFLDNLAAIQPGMSEAEIRVQFPDLGPSEKHAKYEPIARAHSKVSLAGLEWYLSFTFDEGRMAEADLFFSASRRPVTHPKETPPHVPQSKVRALSRQIAAYFASRHGKTAELYLPNVDCPAGDPFGLRKQWNVGDKVIAVDFTVNSSYSDIQIHFAEKAKWDQTMKDAYGKPLEPASKRSIDRAAQDAN
jgi:hypothetical protein